LQVALANGWIATVGGPEPSRENAMKAVRFDQYGGVEREVERRRPGDVSIANPFVRFW
jgi:hypothetical protein